MNREGAAQYFFINEGLWIHLHHLTTQQAGCEAVCTQSEVKDVRLP